MTEERDLHLSHGRYCNPNAWRHPYVPQRIVRLSKLHHEIDARVFSNFFLSCHVPTICAQAITLDDVSETTSIVWQYPNQYESNKTSLNDDINLHDYGFAESVYVATAGRWSLPDDWPGSPILTFSLDYYLSNASMTGTLEDWNLAGFAPNLVAMKTHRMSPEVKKKT